MAAFQDFLTGVAGELVQQNAQRKQMELQEQMKRSEESANKRRMAFASELRREEMLIDHEMRLEMKSIEMAEDLKRRDDEIMQSVQTGAMQLQLEMPDLPPEFRAILGASVDGKLAKAGIDPSKMGQLDPFGRLEVLAEVDGVAAYSVITAINNSGVPKWKKEKMEVNGQKAIVASSIGQLPQDIQPDFIRRMDIAGNDMIELFKLAGEVKGIIEKEGIKFRNHAELEQDMAIMAAKAAFEKKDKESFGIEKKIEGAETQINKEAKSRMDFKQSIHDIKIDDIEKQISALRNKKDKLGANILPEAQSSIDRLTLESSKISSDLVKDLADIEAKRLADIESVKKDFTPSVVEEEASLPAPVVKEPPKTTPNMNFKTDNAKLLSDLLLERKTHAERRALFDEMKKSPDIIGVLPEDWNALELLIGD